MDRYLLDTMAVLWMAFRPELIPKKAARILSDSDSSLAYSTLSLWEIGLKLGGAGYRKFVLPDDWDAQLPDLLQEQGIRRVEILPKHCRLIQDLPFHHRDPFDRLLIAQALIEGLIVISSDDRFDPYGVKRIW